MPDGELFGAYCECTKHACGEFCDRSFSFIDSLIFLAVTIAELIGKLLEMFFDFVVEGYHIFFDKPKK